MKCRITYVVCIFCACFICTSCSGTLPVSTSGQSHDNSTDTNKDSETSFSLEHPTESTDFYNIIENNKSKIPGDSIQNLINKDFIEWVCNSYSPDFAENFAKTLENGTYSDAFWHQSTGCSFHVLWDYYNNTPYTKENNIYTREAASKDKTRLIFAGDLCLSEGWYTLNKYDESGGDLDKCISKELTGQLNHADIFMLNNEFTFSDRGAPLEGKYYTFRADTRRISILKSLGTDVVAVANNHIFDFGADSFYDTLSTLYENDIPYFGGGKNIEEACRPVYFVINGMKIGFVGASRAEKIRYTPEAGTDSPGILLTYDNTEYLKVITEAKKNCDYLIAYVHWGTEDSHEVTQYQQVMGRQFIDAGADIVAGGHPHVLQGIEYYNGKPILYSLGDFWFNYETKETGAIELEISPSGLESMKFLPCMQDNFTTTLITEPTEQRRIYDFLQNLSYGITIDNNGLITVTP